MAGWGSFPLFAPIPMKDVMGALAGKSVDGKAVNEMVRKKLAG